MADLLGSNNSQCLWAGLLFLVRGRWSLPTQSIIYVPFRVSRFPEIVLLIIQYKYLTIMRRIRCSKTWLSAQDYAVLVLLLNMVKLFISAWPKWSAVNDLYQLGTSCQRANRWVWPFNILTWLLIAFVLVYYNRHTANPPKSLRKHTNGARYWGDRETPGTFRTALSQWTLDSEPIMFVGTMILVCLCSRHALDNNSFVRSFVSRNGYCATVSRRIESRLLLNYCT